MKARHIHQGIVALCALWLLLGAAATAFAAGATAPLQLRWEIERTVFSDKAPDGESQALLSLTNRGAQALPAQGWALYFSCIAGVHAGPVDGGLVLEQVVGTQFRLRPAAGFAGVAPGQTLQVRIRHHEVMNKADKGPQGPYVVFDSAPEQGLRIADYAQVLPTQASQLQRGPNDRTRMVSAEDTFQRNATIAEVPLADLPPVFPTPLRAEAAAGTLRWTALPPIQASPALRHEQALARELLQPLLPAAAGRTEPPLQLRIAAIAGQTSSEAHELHIHPTQGVTITGASAAGVSRGLQSLRSLLPPQRTPDASVALPALRLTDAPRFAYRGLQLDVARNFQRREVVLRLLDLMARYKLNTFHFHLTDDEGWRLAIAGLPELTEVGARRGHTTTGLDHLPPAYGSGPDVADVHGSGHYSRADYIAILRRAAALQIEVIPEIEMPGHARAAVKAMAARAQRLAKVGDAKATQYLLQDPADTSVYRSPQLYRDHLMDPGLPSTYAFIAKVVADVVAMHREAGAPLRTLHVGGDETPRGAWEKSPASLALMARLKLPSTVDLWDHFYDRVGAILRKHQLVASGWEELGARKTRLRGEGKLIPNPHFLGRGFRLYVWNDLDDSADLAYRLANAGYRTVLAPATHLYFDMAHNPNPDEHGVNWAAYTDLSTVFDFIPFDFLRKAPTDPAPLPGLDGLTDFGRTQVLGLEGTLFTETVRDVARMDFLLMPRLLALAERAWAADPAWAQAPDAAEAQRLHAAAWSRFVHQVGLQVLPRLDAERAGIGYRIPAPGLARVDGQVRFNSQLPGFELRYTTDGSVPDAKSTRSDQAIVTRDRALVRAALFNRDGRHGAVSVIDNR